MYRKCLENEFIDFIPTKNGRNKSEIASKMSRILEYFWNRTEYTHAVWMDSNNLFSDDMIGRMADSVMSDIPFWGQTRFDMYGVNQQACIQFTFLARDSERHIIGPGKGWTRQAFIDAYKEFYDEYKTFVSKNCRRTMSNDADINAFFHRAKHKPVMLDDYTIGHCIDIKIDGNPDLNIFSSYTHKRFTREDPSNEFGLRDKTLRMLTSDYGDGLQLPVELRDKVSSFLG